MTSAPPTVLHRDRHRTPSPHCATQVHYTAAHASIRGRPARRHPASPQPDTYSHTQDTQCDVSRCRLWYAHHTWHARPLAAKRKHARMQSGARPRRRGTASSLSHSSRLAELAVQRTCRAIPTPSGIHQQQAAHFRLDVIAHASWQSGPRLAASTPSAAEPSVGRQAVALRTNVCPQHCPLASRAAPTRWLCRGTGSFAVPSRRSVREPASPRPVTHLPDPSNNPARRRPLPYNCPVDPPCLPSPASLRPLKKSRTSCRRR